MKSASIVFFVGILISLNPLSASSLTTDYEVVSISYQIASPDQSLPVVQNVTDELMQRESALKGGECRSNQKTAVPESEEVNPVLAVMTNDPDRLLSESPAVFRTLGFFPSSRIDTLESLPTDPIYASFFGELLFLYGGPLPVVIMKKSIGTEEYVYISHVPVTVGRVLEQFLNDRKVYWFSEHTAEVAPLSKKSSPSAARLVIWDESGKLALRIRYNALEWNENSLAIIGNTGVFASTCAPESSAIMCWGKSTTCQLSLLDPYSWEPTVLQTRITMRYVGENLQIDHVRLSLASPQEFKDDFLACETFQTTADILRHPHFGVCGRNLQGITKWRCLGSPDGYLRESQKASQLFWIEVGRQLELEQGSLQLTVDSGITRALASLGADAALSANANGVPAGLGHLDALSMINAVMSALEPD